MSHIFRFIRHSIWMTVNLLAVALLWLAALGMFIPPDGSGGIILYPFSLLPAVLGIGFEWLVLLNVFFAVSWLFTHRKLWSLVSVLALLIVLPALRNTYPLPLSTKNTSSTSDTSETSPTIETSQTLTILSYNTNRLQSYQPIPQNDILHYVKSSGADIVCMEEYAVRTGRDDPSQDGVKRFMREVYPYSYFDFSLQNKYWQYGIAIYSKYPIINKKAIPFDTYGNSAIRCDIVVKSDTFRLFTNHLQSYIFAPKEVDSLLMLPLHLISKNSPIEGDNLNEKSTTFKSQLKSRTSSLSKLSTGYAKRTKQVARVRAEIDASPYPVIVCGDFNDVPVSYTYRQLSRGLNDAFLSGTHPLSLGHTYVRHHLGIRIDYILHSPSFRATDFRIDPLPYSDHYPIRTTLHW